MPRCGGFLQAPLLCLGHLQAGWESRLKGDGPVPGVAHHQELSGESGVGGRQPPPWKTTLTGPEGAQGSLRWPAHLGPQTW